MINKYTRAQRIRSFFHEMLQTDVNLVYQPHQALSPIENLVKDMDPEQAERIYGYALQATRKGTFNRVQGDTSGIPAGRPGGIGGGSQYT